MTHHPLTLIRTETTSEHSLSIPLGEGRQLAIRLQDGYQLYLSLTDDKHLNLVLSKQKNTKANTFSMISPPPLENTTLSIDEHSIKKAFDEILRSTNSKMSIKQIDVLYNNFKKHFIEDSLTQWTEL